MERKDFHLRATAELNYQFTLDEDQEKETQPIFLFSDESKTNTPCSSPGPELPKNAPDTYGAITQLIAAQIEQMSASGNLALQYPPNPPTSLISDDDDDEVFTQWLVIPLSVYRLLRIAALALSICASR